MEWDAGCCRDGGGQRTDRDRTGKAGSPGQDRGEPVGMGQGSWQPQAGQDRVGTAGSMAQDQWGAGKIPLELGIQQLPGIQQHAGKEPQGQARQAGQHGVPRGTGAGSCHPWPRHWRQRDAGKVQGSRQGVGRVLPAPAGCVQPRHSQGADRVPGALGRVQGPRKGCRQGAGRARRYP